MAFRLHPTLESARARLSQATEAVDVSIALPLYIGPDGYIVADRYMGNAYTKSPELIAEPADHGRFYLKHVGNDGRNGTYLAYWDRRLSLNNHRTSWSLRNGRLLAEGDPDLTLCRYFNEGGKYGVGKPSPMTNLSQEERRTIIEQSKKLLGGSSLAVTEPEALLEGPLLGAPYQGMVGPTHYPYFSSRLNPYFDPYHDIRSQDPTLRQKRALDELLYPKACPLYFPRVMNPELHAAFGVNGEESKVHPDDQIEPGRLIHLTMSTANHAPSADEVRVPPWKQAPANIDLLAVSTLDDGLLLGVGTDLSLYTRTSVASVWVKVPNSGLVTGATQLRDGTIVGVGTDGTLWARATLKSSWAQVPNSGTVVAITQLQDETIVGVGTDGALWTRATLGGDWAQVPNSGIMISVRGLADGTILGIGPDNRMYSRATLDDEWTPVPDDREALAVTDLPSRMLVAVGPDHKLYYTPRP